MSMSTGVSRRNFLKGTLGVAALGMGAAACSSGTSSSSVQYWGSFSESAVQKYFTTNMIDAYNKTHKPTVSLVVKPTNSIQQLLKTAVAAGRGPDVILEDGPAQALAYQGANELLPLDDYVSKFHWDSKLLPWALETGKIDGKVYSVPNSYETMALFYSPETFSEHNWKVPTNKDEFEAICTEAAGKGIMPLAVGEADWHATSEWFVTIFLNSFSGPDAVYQGLQGKLKWSDPVFVDAITLLNSYFQKGWFGGSVQSYFTNKRATLDTKLANGQAAMDFSGSWVVAEYEPYFGSKAGNDRSWDWAEIPSFSSHAPAGVYDLSVGGTFSINRKSKLPDGAAAWLDWMLSNTAAQGKALAAVAQEPFPIRLSASDFPAGADKRVERMYIDLGQAKQVGYTTWTFWPPKSDTYIYESMDKVITGDLSPQAYLQGLDTIFAQELKQGLVPPLPKPAATS